MMRRGGETPDEEKARFAVSRDFGKRVKEILGDSPEIVFEHVGKATFPTSVFVVKPFGKVVICGATSGYDLDLDVRHLWMRQKEIIGSHFANAWQCNLANRLIDDGQIRPVLWKTMGFDDVANAHQLMHENKHLGQDRDPRRRRPSRPGRRPTRPGGDLRGGGERHGRRRPHPLVRDGLPRRRARGGAGGIAPVALRYGATGYSVYPLPRRPLQVPADRDVRVQARLGPRLDGPTEFIDFRVLRHSHYQVPVVYGWTDLVTAGVLEPTSRSRWPWCRRRQRRE